MGLMGRGSVLWIVAITTMIGCSSTEQSNIQLVGDAYPNVDPSNSRHVGGPIDAGSVSKLKFAWADPLVAQTFSAYWATPTIAGEVAYSQDSASNVQAIDISNGEVLWKTKYQAITSEGPNGVTVAGGRVYGTTDSAAFALDQKTGKRLWDTTLVRNDTEEVHMAPGYHNGLVYVSTGPVLGKPGGVGTLWALSAKTGERVWSFDTVPKGLWGHPEINSGGGISQPPAFDDEGYMYIGVGNPYPVAGTSRQPWGASRPGPNLYTGSIVKLDAKSGRLAWYYQLTPHAICLWGLTASPVLTELDGRDLVLAAGKSGIVIALDRHSGKLAWRRSVGVHNGHDNDGLQTMRGNYSNVHVPMTVFPGGLGGITSDLATDGSSVFAPVVNAASRLTSQRGGESAGPEKGELIALDLRTGAIQWKSKLPGAPFAAPVAVNDVVFTSTATGQIYAFDGKSGSLLWSATLPAGVMGGLGLSGDTVLAPAGYEAEDSQKAMLVAYRLGG